MPFANYKNFPDCVAKNSDKANPEGYCAMIHKQSTGKYPAEMSQRTLKNVEIFSIGTHTDSSGKTTTYTTNDLAKIVEAFNSGISIPVKLGHTSDNFNEQVAKELAIPESILQGESGKGAAKLGEVVSLSSNGKLVADILLANDDVAKLVQKNYFDNVSIELAVDVDHQNKKYDLAATGLAFLGVQKPAVKNLAGLQASQLLSQGYKFDKLFLHELHLPMVDVSKHESEMFDMLLMKCAEEHTKGDVDELISQWGEQGYDKIKSNCADMTSMPGMFAGYVLDEYDKRKAAKAKESEGESDMSELNTKLSQVLKLSKSDDASILEAVSKLVTTTSKYSEVDTTIQQLNNRIRHFEWKSKVAILTSIPGTPDELATKLADIEAKAGPEFAAMLFKNFEDQNKLAIELNTTKASLTSTNPNSTITDKKYAFEEAVKELAAKDKLSYQQALAKYTMANPKAFGEYHREKLRDLAEIK